VLTHGFHDARELESLKRHAAAAPASVVTAPHAPRPEPAPPPKADERVAALASEVGTLRDELNGALRALRASNERIEALEKLTAELRAALTATQQEFQTFKQSLGG
jgi:HAMP domain-containing protein